MKFDYFVGPLSVRRVMDVTFPVVEDDIPSPPPSDVMPWIELHTGCVHMDSERFCAPESRSRAFEAVSRARFRRAVIARMLPGMLGDWIQVGGTIRRYDGWPAVWRRSLRDVTRSKSNLHVIRCAGRTTDGTRETARVRKWRPICRGSSICLPRVRGNNSLEVRRGRQQETGVFVLGLVEFASSSSNSTYFNCLFDGIEMMYKRCQIFIGNYINIKD